jgi:predicted amidohydrolase YtcJ
MKIIINLLLITTPLFAVDLIFFGGDILTMNDNQPVVEAIAVEDGWITAIGTEENIIKLRTWRTKIVNLQGKTLMPGLIEAHCHPIATAVLSQVVNISGFTYNSRAEIMATISAAVEKASPGKWVLAFGWDPVLVKDLRNPTLAELDSISTEVPIFILTQMMHQAFVNNAVYKTAKITRNTPDPPGGGSFLKDVDGNLNGVIYEFSALQKILKKMPKTPQGTAELLLNLQYAQYAKAGYTTIAALGPVNIAGYPLNFMASLSQNANVPVRSFVYPLKKQLDRSAWPSGYGNDHFRIKGVKLYMDGSPYTGGAAFAEPYLNTEVTLKRMKLQSNHRGKVNYSEASLLQTLTKYHNAGYQIAIHAQGEIAIQMILNAFTEIMENYPRPDHRHRLEHNALITKNQIIQAQKLGLTLSFFMDHVYYYGEQLPQIVGPDRAARFMPLGSAFAVGHRASIHTDNPATPVDPFRVISTAVTRKTKDRGDILGPTERVTINDALKAVTINAAWQLFEDDQRGSITVGKAADFVLLSHNPLRIQPENIKNISALCTWIDGIKINISPWTWTNFKLLLLIVIDYLHTAINNWLNM